MTGAAAADREHVGPYRIVQAIGAGGSARIDLARIDRAYGFQRHVVIKRPLEHLRGNAGVAAQLRREARIGGRLHHPNLVAVLDAGVHDGYDYLVLEYVHGAALRAVMQAETPGAVRELPLAVALSIVCDVARGMHEAHELTDEHGAPLGLVHRDVSPGNILLGLDGTVKLADFGIAKETRISTLSGSMHGTVTYMAPEQCQGHAFDRRADVFSLGVILYELVTGSRLFWADNDVASLHRVLSGNVPRPRSHRPELPGALEDIVVTAVAFDAGKRFATALALASALESYAAAAGQPLGARWIARTMEERIGPRHVPWMAAPTVPDVAPPGEGSLVELIAAAGSDEPVSPSFDEAGGDAPGDVDDDAADDPLTVDAPPGAPPPRATRPEPTPEIAAEPSRLPARTRASLRRPALVGLVALVAVTAFGGALALTRSRAPAPATRVTAPVASPAPATAAPRTPASAPVISREPAAPPGSSSPSAGQPAGIDPGAAATHASPTPSPELAPPSPPAAPGPTEASSAPPVPPVAQIEPPPARSTKKRRPSRTPRPGARGVAAGHATVHTAGKVEPPPAPPGPGSGSAAPTTRAPVNVEWKPTLLLPSDGSGARTPR